MGESVWAGAVVMNSQIDGAARVRVLSESNRGVVIAFECGAVTVDSSAGAGAVAVSIDRCGQVSRPGWPELPAFSEWVRVPSTSCHLSLEDLSNASYRWGVPQCVAEPMDRVGESDFRRMPAAEFYASTGTYPDQAVAVSYTGHAGGETLALVTFYPVRYSAGSEEWTVHSRIVARLAVSDRDEMDRDRSGEWTRSSYVQRAVLNPSGGDHGRPTHGARMLVVTTPELRPALQDWLEWKMNCGVPCYVVNVSDVATSAEQLRAFVRAYTDSLESRPEFLFLVGTAEQIPPFFGVDGSLTDHPYSLLDDQDYLADLSVGRLPVRTPGECTQWVTRLLAYERDGILPSSPAATVFSSSSAQDPEHGRSVSTLLSGRGLSVTSLQQPQSGSLTQLMTGLALSPTWIFYIGHGNAQAWSSVAPMFDLGAAADADNCRSAIVVSVACTTNDFDYPGLCLGSAWVTGNANAAPLAYIGATEPTAFFRSDTLGLGIMRGVFSEQIERIGAALDYGKLRLIQSFPQGAGGLTEETVQQFCLLGDPSMRCFSGPLRDAVVGVPMALPLDIRTISVSVSANGRSIANAEVCVRDTTSNLHEIATTNALGEATFSVHFTHTTTVQWSVTGINLHPEHGVIHIVPRNGYFLQPTAIAIVDTAGDQDSTLDRGEQGIGHIELTNLGNLTSPAGTLTAASSSTVLSIHSTARQFPPVSPGAHVIVNQVFDFAVSDDAADGDAAIVSITSQLEDSTILASLPVVVHAPEPSYAGSILREDSGNGNGRPDAGERLELTLYFTNTGGDELRDLQVQITSVSPGVELAGNSCTSAACLTGDSVACHFVLHASDALGRGAPLNFEFSYSASHVDTRTAADMQRIGMIPVLLYVLDRNPADVQALRDALTSLGIESEWVSTLPNELGVYQSIWVFSGTYPNQVPVSYAASNRLSDYLDQGGNIYWQGGDVWAFDLRQRLHGYFHITGVSDGAGDAGPIAGEFGTMLQDYNFVYSGENSFIDRLGVENGSQVMLRNARSGHDYPVCISYASPIYRTIGSSIELGSLEDGIYPSTRIRIVNEILSWFRIPSRADLYPPVISHVPVREVYGQRVPVRIHADIQDASGVAAAAVLYRVNEDAPQSIPMEFSAGHFIALLPFASSGATVYYQITAQDSSLERNVALSPEYSYRVSSDEGIALNYSFGGVDPQEIAHHVTLSEDAGWSLTDYAAMSCLELFALESGRAIYRTSSFRVKGLRYPALQWWCSLNSGDETTCRLVVRSSIDGGRTFPQELWTSADRSGHWEGTVQLLQQTWLQDQDSVCLEFEFSGDGWARLANLAIRGETAAIQRSVRHLVVHPEDGRVVLNWQRMDDARYFVIHASVRGLEAGDMLPIAMTRDTVYVDSESNRYASRLYTAYGVIVEGRTIPRVSDAAGLHESSPRAEDLRWKEKRRRLQRQKS